MKLKQRLFATLVSLMITGTVALAPVQAANPEFTLTIKPASGEMVLLQDGKTTKLQSAVAPYIVNGTTMVPIREIGTALGADVEYLGHVMQHVTPADPRRTDDVAVVRVSSGSTFLIFWDRFNAANLVNKQESASNQIALTAPPMIVKDKLLVPIRALAENLGYLVIWDSATSTILVTK